MTAPRIAHPRFDALEVAQVYASFNADGATARIVGGAVRNALLGRPITDIDFATTTRPDETTRRAEAAGFKVVPTGFDHGTVLLVAPGGDTFEVTTLREDVETDGRRAVVRFGTDWTRDASRRDFTMNALYRDADGTLFDPLGGAEDARAGCVRFIGDARRRIEEDGLRILRFFRFCAEYGDGALDPDGLAACAELRDRMAGLSGERIRAELLKTLAAPAVGRVLPAMRDAGTLDTVWDGGLRLDRFEGLCRIALPDGRSADPLLRLASLLPESAAKSATESAAERLRLSRVERERMLGAIAAAAEIGAEGAAPDRNQTALHLYRLGRERLLDGVLLAAADASDPASWVDAYGRAKAMDRPHFPLAGRDVIAAGAAPGPEVGATLRAVEARWIAEGFPGPERVSQMLADEMR